MMQAVKCKECKIFPTIYNDCGCGNIYCEKCGKGRLTSKYQFNGKLGAKRKAILKWNNDNSMIEVNNHDDRSRN